ncbi:MAG: transcription-repair coupling factor [Planctomycetaceae bacterium]|nr:transcription-repair coupling factor [Planctomycetaceae bacterium]
MPKASAGPDVAIRLQDLTRTLQQTEGWEKCLKALEEGQPASFDSVWGSSCALFAAALHDVWDGNIVFVFPGEREAQHLTEDWPAFSDGPIELYPTVDQRRPDDLSADPGFGRRLRILKDLARDNKLQPVIATSIQALSHPVTPPQEIVGTEYGISVGSRLAVDEFREWLAENAYQTTSSVKLPGEFSARGGIIDIFAPDWTMPARIELFDDEIESIRFFDPASQRSIEKCSGLNIAGLPTQASEQSAHLSDYFGSRALIILVEPNEIEHQSRQLIERQSSDSNLHNLEQLQTSWKKHAVAFAGRLITETDTAFCRLPVSLIEQFSGDISNVRMEMDRIAVDRDSILLASTESEINRVREILSSTELSKSQRLHFTTGGLHAGFRLEPDGPMLLSTNQLFNRSDLRRKIARKNAKPIDSFIDLRNGDLIVHLAHGIGRYRGLKVLEKDGHRTEHLELEFYGGTRIYLPATKISLVQKYVGGSKNTPRLARIGGKTWQKQKEAAEAAVGDMAAEMLEIQASRSSRPGLQFGEDTPWQFEFEHSFPYQETPDQLTAIAAIKGDMETKQPMDRLLCGDVGFGKTEVAMRAAFKAVENGYQVAMLAPTTVLVEQHYRTFKERMAEFPVDIGKLSRFSSPSEQRDTVDRIRKGNIDIVIGTHRITSKDINFKNCGLIIIDEEQKFGVGHKERLKSMRNEVDVLTMSATPIPRTLHMSLVGVRDISNLETPPEERMAVSTRVTKFDDRLIRDSVLRELERGGQTYFVHNRVKDIHIVQQRLQHIVPEAKIGIGHGQMGEGELEEAMAKFISGEFDIFLATTIVENGLDIPNANTIFIDEADRYGLSDLHQLRGRVGRYKNKAYCYLLIEPHKHVNPNAAKRLHAIEMYSEMGAGFAIAMRDLEIRGAGNLLGTEQSGHIASVGYELYCQLLETAVRELRKLPAKIKTDVDIDLPIEAYLPDNYVTENKQKVDLYRRLSQVQSFKDVKAIKAELRDRFGKLPPAVLRLIKLSELRLEATLWQISHVFLEDNFLGMRFRDSARMRQFATASKYNIRLVDDSTAYLTLKTGAIPPDKLMVLLKSILQPPAVLS